MRTIQIITLVEFRDESIRYRTFRHTGRLSIPAMRRNITARVRLESDPANPITRIAHGRALVTFNYGAH